MAYVSVLAQQLQRLLLARDWRCTANRFTLEAVEPALEEIHHVWMAGDASSLTDGEIRQVRPTRIIVRDLTSAAEAARLEGAMSASGREPRLSRFTKFIDLFWDAPRAAVRARLDAESQDDLPGFSLTGATPDLRHVKQHLKLGGLDVADNRLLEKALAVNGSSLAILADAGLGKSELLKWHEWRYAVFYQSADSQQATTLPPVALRVPLRGLRLLSLDSLAHYLSHPADDNNLPALSRVDTGRCLLELLRLQRIILLLDGADELMMSSDKLSEGLREIGRAVADGGRVILSTRIGHLSSSRSIRASFKSSEIATIEPMSPEAARQLLTKYGASPDRADEVLKGLTPSPAQGIPLFLLMALTVGVTNQLDASVLPSRTRVLLELLRLFCKRDEPRLGVPLDEQMRLLTEFAHWTNLIGELDGSSALEYLGIDPNEPESAIIVNPHALLTRTPDEIIRFKYPQFYSLFLAKALSDDWHSLGFQAVIEDLRGTKLNEATTEYLARLIEEPDISQAWSIASGDDELLRFPLVRRNLLAVALARLEDESADADPQARSARLASLLGSRQISDVMLSDLVLQRIDLGGWTLRLLQGRGSLLYCTNLDQCDFDSTVQSLDLEGTELPRKVDRGPQISRGTERLRKIVRPLRRKGSNVLIGMISLGECRDTRGWGEIGRAGLAEQQRRGGGGERYWVLNESGMRLLGKFADADGSSGEPLRAVLQSDDTLLALVTSLGKLK